MSNKLQKSFPCPKCGAAIPIGQWFCGTCGERFEYRCAQCGATTATVSGFCTYCGRRLLQQSQPTEPLAAMPAMPASQVGQEKAMPHPLAKLGAYLGIMAVLLGIVAALYYFGTGPLEGVSRWLGGGFIFQGNSPPTSAPAPPSTDVDTKPVSVPDSPHYTLEEVTRLAKAQSPTCRLPSRRGG